MVKKSIKPLFLSLVYSHMMVLVFGTVVLLCVGFLLSGKIVAQTDKKSDSTEVRLGELADELSISGSIDAEEKATIRFQTSGKLTWVGVKQGDYVRKNQALAALDSREVKKKLQKELNDYMNTRWDFDQTTKDDYKDRALTDKIKRILDKAQFDLNNSVLDVEIQSLALELANLTTPIEGIVTKVGSPYAGVNIIPSQAEFDVVNPASIYFSATADQNEVVKLKEGLSGELVLDSYPDKTIPGTIKLISFLPKAGETGTVYEVKFIFSQDNSTYLYRIGMTGDVKFITAKTNSTLYLPVKFVKQEEGGKKYVKVKRNGKEQKVYITTGMETDNYIAITSGLSAGETVYD